MTIRGKQHTIRIISAYRPCHSLGPETVYAQHSRFFHNQPPYSKDRRQRILDDLSTQITEWQTQGDLIILCMDANDDIREPPISRFIETLQLHEAILSHHPRPPSTCDKNRQRQPIDGIWTSPSIHISQSGYLPFGQGCPSDHRMIWADIPIELILGTPSRIKRPTPRRLKASDHRLVDRYIQHLLPQLQQHNLIDRMQKLNKQAQTHGWSCQLEQEFN